MEIVRGSKRTALPMLTDRLPLGETGLEVSPICLGIVSTEDAVSAAFDAGINFFFITADLHWPAYEPLRRGLNNLLSRGSGIREKIVVAAASYVTQPWFFTGALHEVAKSVRGLETIDLAIAGGAYSSDYAFRLEQYHDARARGWSGMRAIGMSFHDRKTALIAANQKQVDIAFIRYNPGHPGAREDVFPYLNGSSSILYNFKSTTGHVRPARYAELGLDESYWRPKITDYYRFALTRPEIEGLLCSPATPQEVEELAAAISEGPLDDEEEEHLINLAALGEGHSVLKEKASQTSNGLTTTSRVVRQI